jgi:hypothetical protein
VFVCLGVFVCVYVYVCTCVRESERGREGTLLPERTSADPRVYLLGVCARARVYACEREEGVAVWRRGGGDTERRRDGDRDREIEREGE